MIGIQAKGEFSQIEKLPKSFMEVVFNLDREQFIHKYLVSFTWAEGVQVPVCLILLGWRSPIISLKEFPLV